jgi:Stage II sporulation protein E (SpoIIE)
MPRRFLYVKVSPVFLLFLFVSALSAAARSAVIPPLTIQGVGAATAPLGGQWQFHTGDNPGWAAPDFDDSAWEPIGVDKSWGAQSHFGYTGSAWYRRHITFDPVAGANTDLGLFLPPIDDAYELYWNGRLIGQSGKLPPNPAWYFYSPYQTFNLDRPQSGVLALRVWKAPYVSYDSGVLGGLSEAPLVGSSDAIAAYKVGLDHRWLKSRQYDFALDLLYALVALLSLLAWLRNRNQKILFWVAVYSLCPLVAEVLIRLRLPFHFEFALGVLQVIISLADVSLWFLLLYVLQLDNQPRLRRWTRILAIVSLTAGTLDGALLLFQSVGGDSALLQIADAVLTAIVAVVEVFPLVLIAFALQKRLDAARWFVAIFAFLRDFIIVLRTTLSQGERFTHWTIGQKINEPLFTVSGNRFTALTLASTLLFIAIVYAVYRYTVDQSRRQGALEQEYKSAQELQRVLIPDTLPSIEGYSVTSAYSPAEEVGGDFFQLIALNNESTLLVLGDVSGKGLKAAMTVSLIVGAVRTLAEISNDPAEILSGLNRRLHGRLHNGFVTCLILRLHADGECELANAGHPSPFLNEQEVSLPGTLPLGLLAVAAFENTTIHVAVGDRLTLYTDGLLEARNASGELYSFDRLQQLIATKPDARQASDAAVAFGQDDDITVLTVTRLERGEQSTTMLMAPELVSATG